MNADPGGHLTLPEELLLLSLHPSTGRRLCRARFLQYGVAGAVLAELALGGHVAEERGRVVVTGPLPPADPLLAAALAELTTGAAGAAGARGKGPGAKGPRTRAWVRRAGRRLEEPWLDRLVERGALRRESRRFLRLIPYHCHPVASADLTTPARIRLDEARHAGFPDPRSRALGALLGAIDVHARLYPGWDARRTRRELRRLTRQEWPAEAVYRNVRQDKSSDGSASAGASAGAG
ncbi:MULTISPECIES: GPP34 family phosphoprotein [Streptomyces]|uniref:GPP34 family phosphoprotein n=1 Tax=Streptomyces luteosporeus TaxID=173856 RepID=A0ABP6G5H5_9ACTN